MVFHALLLTRSFSKKKKENNEMEKISMVGT